MGLRKGIACLNGILWSKDIRKGRKVNISNALINATFGAWLCMVLKLGRFGQQIRNTWKVLKCGAGEGWRRSAGPIV